MERSTGRDRRGRRRRRLWRRLDAATSWVLAALVGLSLALGALLWSESPPLPAGLPAGAGAPGYVAPDALGRVNAGALLLPGRILMLYRGGPDVALGDPAANPLFQSLWRDVLTLLAGAAPHQAAGATAISPKDVGERLEALAAGSGAAEGATEALAVDLGPRLAWGEWWRLFGRGPWRGPECPGVGSLVVMPGPAATVVYVLSGDCGLALALPASAGAGLGRLLAAQQGQPQPLGYAVAPLLAPRLAPFGVQPGIFVPVRPTWQPVRLAPEPLDADLLAGAIFPDPLGVRRRVEADGSILYSDPQDRVLTVNPAAGSAELEVPAAGEGGGCPGDWVSGLDCAAAFVATHGGWPPSAWLSSVQYAYPPGRCLLTACPPVAYTFAFRTRYQGLPVYGSAPAVSLSVGGAGVLSYARAVPVAGGPAARGFRPWVSAETALAALEAAPPPSLVYPPLQVTDMYPAWDALPVDGVLEPAWAVVLSPAGGGPPRLALVDALRAQVLDVLSEG